MAGILYFHSSLVEVKEQQQEFWLFVVELKVQKKETAKTVQHLRETIRTQGILLAELQLQFTIVSVLIAF